MPDSGRLELLLQDSDFFVHDVELFCRQLGCLLVLSGRETVQRWQAQARAGRIAKAGVGLQQSDDPLELLQESPGNACTGRPAAALAPSRSRRPHLVQQIGVAIQHLQQFHER